MKIKVYSFLFFLLLPLASGFASCRDGDYSNQTKELSVSKLKALVITDSGCSLCSTELSRNALKDIFPELSFEIIDYQQQKAQQMIKEQGISTLPAFILPFELKQHHNFDKLGRFFKEKHGKIILDKEITGVFFFLDRKEVPRRIDYFLDIYDGDAAGVFQALTKFAKNNNIEVDIHLVFPQNPAHGYPEEEIKVALAVKITHSEKFIDYLEQRVNSVKTKGWMTSLEELRINYPRIKEVLDSPIVSELIDDNRVLVDELDVRDGNVIFINNNRMFKIYQADDEILKQLLNHN